MFFISVHTHMETCVCEGERRICMCERCDSVCTRNGDHLRASCIWVGGHKGYVRDIGLAESTWPLPNIRTNWLANNWQFVMGLHHFWPNIYTHGYVVAIVSGMSPAYGTCELLENVKTIISPCISYVWMSIGCSSSSWYVEILFILLWNGICRTAAHCC